MIEQTKIKNNLESKLLATLGKGSRYRIRLAECLGYVTIVIVNRDGRSAVQGISIDTNNLAFLILGHSILAELYKVLGVIRCDGFLDVIITIVFVEDLLPKELLHAIDTCG